jgi:hypothetical protein
MPDKVSLSKKAIQSIENFEGVSLCALEVASMMSEQQTSRPPTICGVGL